MKNTLFVSCLLFLFIGCNDEAPEAVEIRVKNTSDFSYVNLTVSIMESNNYGSLGPGKLSEYKTFSEAYRYAYVSLEIEGEALILQPIDYVGETPLKKGKYTYHISMTREGDQLSGITVILEKG